MLPFGKVVLYAAMFIDNNLVVLEARPIHLHLVDASDFPANTEVHLLDLPVFHKDGAPDAGQNGVGQRVLGKELPSNETRDGGEDHKHEICLKERKVKSHFWAMKVANLVIVVDSQDKAPAQMS